MLEADAEPLTLTLRLLPLLPVTDTLCLGDTLLLPLTDGEEEMRTDPEALRDAAPLPDNALLALALLQAEALREALGEPLPLRLQGALRVPLAVAHADLLTETQGEPVSVTDAQLLALAAFTEALVHGEAGAVREADAAGVWEALETGEGEGTTPVRVGRVDSVAT